MSSSRDEYVKRMSSAIRAGAKMTSEVCPVCSNPLLNIRDELWCLACDKRVVKVSEESQAAAATAPYILAGLNATLVSKIEEFTILMRRAADPEQVRQLAETVEVLVKLLRESRELEGATRAG